MWFSFCFSFFSSPPPIDGVEISGVIIVTQGESVTLPCDVMGNPPPSITWLKDGQALGAVWQELLHQPQWGPGHTADVTHRWGWVYLSGIQRGWKLNQRYPHNNPEWVQCPLSLYLPFLFVHCTISEEYMYIQILAYCLIISSSFHCLVIN